MSVSDWYSHCGTNQVFKPTTICSLARFLANNKIPVSVAGAQFSSGGQTLINNGIIISLKNLNKILDWDNQDKTYVVETGATWKKVITYLVKKGRVPAAMQSYYSFSVGGSISVNAHGRFNNRVSDSLIWLDLMIWDGTIYRCSREENFELFNAVIGGYGLIGIIVRAKLKTSPNQKIKCKVYKGNFDYRKLALKSCLYNCNLIQGDKKAHFVWESLGEKFSTLIKKETSQERHVLSRFAENSMYFVPGLKESYQWIQVDQNQDKITYLSEEMADDAAKHIPVTGLRLIQAMLQEFFLPPDKIDKFINRFTKIGTRYPTIRIINKSIRVIFVDEKIGLLDWTKGQTVIALVIYLYAPLKDCGCFAQEYEKFSGELIEAVLNLNGSFYLPYYPFFTKREFLASYPNWPEFLEIKKRWDPHYIFQSKFWDYLNQLKMI